MPPSHRFLPAASKAPPSRRDERASIHTMVAMLGAIMPLPLPMAPTVQVLPPSSNWMAYSFLWVSVVVMAVAAHKKEYAIQWVSVVMMAVAASVLPCASAASLAAAAGMPRAKGSMTMG